ncbi:hypothetical protein [uncultured Microbacterium sp.]|uniref:hypothetical protein n=1 Tax=uncultured Microbacterium sp. TaxID=191216 RepID=UPI0025CEA7EE|nr:hypothetical protein [uncultured Microbacterium sp.]
MAGVLAAMEGSDDGSDIDPPDELEQAESAKIAPTAMTSPADALSLLLSMVTSSDGTFPAGVPGQPVRLLSRGRSGRALYRMGIGSKMFPNTLRSAHFRGRGVAGIGRS